MTSRASPVCLLINSSVKVLVAKNRRHHTLKQVIQKTKKYSLVWSSTQFKSVDIICEATLDNGEDYGSNASTCWRFG